MKRSLDNLLREADAAGAGAPALPPDLAGRVMQRARRRSRRRAAFGAGAAVAVVVAGILLWGRFGSRPDDGKPPTLAGDARKPAPLPAEDARARLAALDAQADSEAAVAVRVAALLRQDDRLDRLRREAQRPGIMADVDRRIEEAALAAIQSAEQEYRTLNRPADAAANYERIIRTYPDTAPALIARRRLTEIRGLKDSSNNMRKEYGHEEARADDDAVRGGHAVAGGGRLRPV